MNEELIKALTTKFPGVSAQIIGRIAAKLAKTATTAEQIKTAVDGTTLQQVIDSYTESRVTEASATAHKNAVEEYEKQHNIKDGKPITPPEDGDKKPINKQADGDEMPAWAKQLFDKTDKLADSFSRFQTERTASSRKQQLDAITGKLPEPMRKAYDRYKLDGYSDEEFTTLLTEITNEAAEIERTSRASSAVTGRPLASRTNAVTSKQGDNKAEQATDEEVNAVVAHLNI
jgi:hypothetical protein